MVVINKVLPVTGRKGMKSPLSVAMSPVAIAATTRVGGGLKISGVVGGVDLGSQIEDLLEVAR